MLLSYWHGWVVPAWQATVLEHRCDSVVVDDPQLAFQHPYFVTCRYCSPEVAHELANWHVPHAP